MKALQTKRTKEPGLPPGTLVHIGKKRTKKVTIDLIEYNETDFNRMSITDPGSLDKVKEEGRVSWINVNGLHDTGIMERISSIFSIHPLLMEDVMNTGQRPKFEVYPDHLFIVMKMMRKDSRDNNILEQVSLIIGDGYVISFQEKRGDVFDPVRNRIRTSGGRIRKMGADYLAYALIDALVDNYFPILDSIGDTLAGIEVEINENVDESTFKNIHRIKWDLIQIRKSIWPMREVLSGLMREGGSMISEEVKPFLRDVYDHVIIAMDALDTNREMSSGARDLYMSLVSNRMNEIMKVLTIIATIFIPLTFIAGIYGMNFDTDTSPWNMPELGWYLGYPLTLGLMAFIAFLMLLFFRKKGWLS